jgi:ribosomal protein S18 acetylase RimI-like enzyme
MSLTEHLKLNDGTEVTIRPMTRNDLEWSFEFFSGLPLEDRASLRRDVTKREILDDRIREMEHGSAKRLIALSGDKIVADGALELATFGWEQHVGEFRLIVAPSHQRKGLGRLMARALYGLAAGAGIDEIIVKMMPSQTAARDIFRRLGFREETVLKNYVIDTKGKKQDLIVMRCGLEDLWEQFEDFVYEADLHAFRMY